MIIQSVFPGDIIRGGKQLTQYLHILGVGLQAFDFPRGNPCKISPFQGILGFLTFIKLDQGADFTRHLRSEGLGSPVSHHPGLTGKGIASIFKQSIQQVIAVHHIDGEGLALKIQGLPKVIHQSGQGGINPGKLDAGGFKKVHVAFQHTLFQGHGKHISGFAFALDALVIHDEFFVTRGVLKFMVAQFHQLPGL